MDQLKLFVEQNREKVMWGVCAILLIVGYGAGFMHARGAYKSVAVESETPFVSLNASPSTSPSVLHEEQGPFVASKKGSYYYPPDCEAKSILNPATIVAFDTIHDAKAGGYKLSPRCSQ